jgi:hypothetical protein
VILEPGATGEDFNGRSRPMFVPLKTFYQSAAAFAASRVPPFNERPMQRRPLAAEDPSSGEQLPVIGLGTWQTFDVGRSQDARDTAGRRLKTFVELGGKLVDSSPMYGNSRRSGWRSGLTA